MVTKSLAAIFGGREKHPVAGYVQGQTLRGHLPSTTSMSLRVAHCRAPLDQWILLTKSRVGRYRTQPQSESKGTWDDRASHPAHLLDPSRRAKPRSSNSASCGRGGGRDRHAGNRFGSTVFAVPQTPTISFESYDKANPGSYVTFVFHYRTLGAIDMSCADLTLMQE